MLISRLIEMLKSAQLKLGEIDVGAMQEEGGEVSNLLNLRVAQIEGCMPIGVLLGLTPKEHGEMLKQAEKNDHIIDIGRPKGSIH